MANTSLETAQETKYIEKIEGFFLAAQQNIFMMAKTFYELKRDNQKLYQSVKSKLNERRIIPNTTVKELALVAESREGFLIENQDRLPKTRYVLYDIARFINGNDDNFNRVKTLIKQKSLENLTRNKIFEALQIEDKTSDDIFESEVIKTEKKVNVVSNEKSITINIPKSVLNNEKKVLKDFKKIKEIMDYADIETHGSLEKFITGQDD